MTDRIPSPRAVFDAMVSYQRTAAMKAAVEIDLFTAVGEGLGTPEELAARCSASARGVRALCDRLVVDGFLAKQDARYSLSPAASIFLDRRSAAYMGGSVAFLSSPLITEAFTRLTAAVRRGGTAVEGEGTLAPEHPVWVDFARAMAPSAALTAEALAGVVDLGSARRPRILDIAAGHGMYGITFARHHPAAEVVAVDWPNVLEVARENAGAAGVADRVRTVPGSAFTADLGSGYDLVLLTNFLHHFDPPTCEGLIARVGGTLAPGGRIAAVEFVPDEDRVSPAEAAAFALVMLATTPAGDAYTFAEYRRMFAAAGFPRLTLHELAPSPQRAVVAER